MHLYGRSPWDNFVQEIIDLHDLYTLSSSNLGDIEPKNPEDTRSQNAYHPNRPKPYLELPQTHSLFFLGVRRISGSSAVKTYTNTSVVGGGYQTQEPAHRRSSFFGDPKTPNPNVGASRISIGFWCNILYYNHSED